MRSILPLVLLVALPGACSSQTAFEPDAGDCYCTACPTCPEVSSHCDQDLVADQVDAEPEADVRIEDVGAPDEVAPEDTAAPKLSVKLKLDSVVLTGIAEIKAEVTGGDIVLGVEFYVGNQRLDTDFIPPYNATVNTTDFKEGPQMISVFTADKAGQQASDSVQVTFDNTPPVITSTTPVDGTSLFYEDGPVHMAMTVDDEPSIKEVQFRANGLLITSFLAPPFQADMTYDKVYILIDMLPKSIFFQFQAIDWLGQKTEVGFNVNVYKRFLWSFETLGEIWATAVLLPDGRIAFGNLNNKLYAVTPEGTEAWSYTADASITVDPAVDPSSGRVFFGALDGKVYAVTDGSQQWTYNMNSPPGGAIRYQNGTVYVAAYNGNVYALSPDSGGVQWQATVNDFISASPAVGPDNTVYIGSQDGKLYAIQNGGTKFTVPTGGEVWSCPAISPDHSVYFGSNDGWIYAVYDDGSQKWVEEIEGQIWGRPLVSSDNFVYVASTSKHVFKLDAATGDKVWDAKLDGISYSSPTEGPDGTIYIGTTSGKIFALNPENGAVKWSYLIGDTIHASPLLVGNRLYVGSTNRNLTALWIAPPGL